MVINHLLNGMIEPKPRVILFNHLRKCFFLCPQEWAYYLRINPNDDSMLWLVRAMMETELPKPWTCYKAGDGGDGNSNQWEVL